MKDKQIDLHRVITVIISIVWMAFQTYIILGKPMNHASGACSSGFRSGDHLSL